MEKYSKEYTTMMETEFRQNQIIRKLNQLSQDFIQADLGAEIEDIEERKQEFKELHNELRELLGKPPRIYTR